MTVNMCAGSARLLVGEKLTLQTRLYDIQRVENQRRHDACREASGGLNAGHLRLGSSILFLHYGEGF